MKIRRERLDSSRNFSASQLSGDSKSKSKRTIVAHDFKRTLERGNTANIEKTEANNMIAEGQNDCALHLRVSFDLTQDRRKKKERPKSNCQKNYSL